MAIIKLLCQSKYSNENGDNSDKDNCKNNHSTNENNGGCIRNNGHLNSMQLRPA